MSSGLGKMFGNQVDPNAVVPGTGSTAAALKADYPALNDADLKGMGAKSMPSDIQQGAGEGLQRVAMARSAQPPQRGSGAPPAPIPQAPTLTPSFDPNYLLRNLRPGVMFGG